MEPIAVNYTEITEKLFNEAARDPLRKKYNALTIKVAGALVLLLGILFLITRSMKADSQLLIGEILILAAVVAWIRFSLPRTERKRAFQHMAKAGPPRRETRFFAGSFTVIGDENREIAYDEISGFRSTAHLHILTLAGGGEVMLDKNGFQKGSWEIVRTMF